MVRKLTAVSLFSGCGGFDWGAQEAGVEIIWANDIDPHAAAAYRSLFPDVPLTEGDIQKVSLFPQADVLIGCYPCTGFSGASRRRWHDRDERNLRDNDNNFLYTQFLRALGHVNPTYLFVENVKGMASAEDGWFLSQQIEGFNKLGYQVKHEVLNACDFGVPQTRKRMFIVGVKDGMQDFSYEFARPTHGPGKGSDYSTLADALAGMDDWPYGEFFDYEFHGHYLTRNRKRAWTEPSYTIVADAHHVPLHPIGEPMVFVEKDRWALQGGQNRRLSWQECAALQGLPLKVAPSGTIKNKYRVVGNAVPPAFGKILLAPVVAFEAQR